MNIGPLELLILLIVLGLAGGVVALVRRARGRRCPRCGTRVKVGVMDCPACEFDFRTIGAEHGP